MSTNSEEKIGCIVCGYKTLDSKTDWDICPICFWEDDVLLLDGDDDDRSPANGEMLVSTAQINYRTCGAADPADLEHVRSADGEELSESFRLLPAAQKALGED